MIGTLSKWNTSFFPPFFHEEHDEESKKKATGWGKLFVYHIHNKRLASKIHLEKRLRK